MRRSAGIVRSQTDSRLQCALTRGIRDGVKGRAHLRPPRHPSSRRYSRPSTRSSSPQRASPTSTASSTTWSPPRSSGRAATSGPARTTTATCSPTPSRRASARSASDRGVSRVARGETADAPGLIRRRHPTPPLAERPRPRIGGGSRPYPGARRVCKEPMGAVDPTLRFCPSPRRRDSATPAGAVLRTSGSADPRAGRGRR